MLYMVELDFTEPSRLAEWNAWYLQHLQILLSVPGFRTAQRFLCTTPHPAPYLAVYTVDSADVFESAAYRARGGRDSTGDWKSSMVNWDRNVFDGVDRLPAVRVEELLLLTDDPAVQAHGRIAFSTMIAVGLDRTVARRAIAIADASQGGRVAEASRGTVRAYRPLMAQRLAGA